MEYMNLRERQKRETRALIQRAAFDLAAKGGIEGLTNEAICEAAGVSQRTFHNYFAFKEAVFIVTPEPLPPEAIKRFVTSTGDLMEDLAELMAAHAATVQQVPRLGKLLHDVMGMHPKLMPLQHAEFMKFDQQMIEVIAARLGRDTEDPACAGLAGAVLGANRTTVDRWMRNPDFDLPAAIRVGLLAVVGLIRQCESGAMGTRSGIAAA
jgi:AcrR family transcriptional regulator